MKPGHGFPTAMAGGCIFCRIARREAPASVVREDDATLAFLDIRPINPGHVLVIPRTHAARLADLPPGVGGRVFEAAKEVAAGLLRSGLRCEGVNFHLADGEAAGQEVFHVHLHVYPRFPGDGVGLRVGPGYGRSPPREELEAAAEAIRRALLGSRGT